MKKLAHGLLPIALLLSIVAVAQDDKKTSKTEKSATKKQITIQKSENGKSEKIVVEVNGDNVTINGKPASEYKGDKKIFIDNDIIINGNSVIVPNSSNKKSTFYSYSSSNRALLGVSTENHDKGALVKEVTEKSGAEKAGIKEGDIITKINSEAISTSNDLVKTIRNLKPEDNVDVTVLRNNKEVKLKATLGKSENFAFQFPDIPTPSFHIDPPLAMTMPKAPRAPKAPFAPRPFDWNGDSDLWIYRSDRPKYGLSIEDNAEGDGVKITNVEDDSNAKKAGLENNDIITEVDGKAVKNVDELKNKLVEAKENSAVDFKILRNGSAQNIKVTVPKVIKKAEL